MALNSPQSWSVCITSIVLIPTPDWQRSCQLLIYNEQLISNPGIDKNLIRNVLNQNWKQLTMYTRFLDFLSRRRISLVINIKVTELR